METNDIIIVSDGNWMAMMVVKIASQYIMMMKNN